MTEPRLDPARIAQLRQHADGGIAPIDPMVIATAAMATRRRWVPAWSGRPMILVLLGALLLAALAMAVAVGGRPSGPPPALFTSLGTPGIGWGSAAVRLDDGRVLIVGSLATDPEVFQTGEPAAWLWDPSTGAFVRTGDPATARELPATAVLPDGRVLVAGGTRIVDLLDGTGDYLYLETAELYDPATGTFTPTGPMSAARGWDHTRQIIEHPFAVGLDDGRIFVAGVYGSVDVTGQLPLDLYDPATGGFQRVASVEVDHTGGFVPIRLLDARVLMRFNDAAWIYDPVDDSVRATGTQASIGSREPEGASVGSANLLPDGRVLFTGALSRTSSGIHTDDPAEIYDPASATFTAVADPTNPRAWPGGASVTLADGRILFLDADGALLFDPVTESFIPLGESPEGILSQGHATLLDDGRVLILGSNDTDSVHASVFDPAALIQPIPEGSADT